MPRKRSELVLLAQRVATARKIVSDQQALIARLAAAGEPTIEAEKALQSYLSALRHLEEHARNMRAKHKRS